VGVSGRIRPSGLSTEQRGIFGAVNFGRGINSDPFVRSSEPIPSSRALTLLSSARSEGQGWPSGPAPGGALALTERARCYACRHQDEGLENEPAPSSAEPCWRTGDPVSTSTSAGDQPVTPTASLLALRRGRKIPALIAVFEPAGTAVALQRNTEMIRPDRHPEFS
jgi:hypothetical protein